MGYIEIINLPSLYEARGGEAEMLLSKTDFKLNAMKMEGYVYQCVLSSCAENSIYEINEMLEANGIPPLGSDSELQ